MKSELVKRDLEEDDGSFNFFLLSVSTPEHADLFV